MKFKCLLGFFALVMLNSCSAGFDDYRLITEAKIERLYENYSKRVRIKTDKGLFMDVQVISHEDQKGKLKCFYPGDNVRLYQLIKNGKKWKCCLSSAEMTPGDFKYLQEITAWNKTKLLSITLVLLIMMPMIVYGVYLLFLSRKFTNSKNKSDEN